MGVTSIEWVHYTFNLVWGCTRVSEACRFCYAETWSRRLGLDIWGVDKPRRTFGDGYWTQPLGWNTAAAKAGERRRVFCSSMADVFEDHPTVDEERVKLWPLIRATPSLEWLLLTKRPENFARFLPPDWGEGYPNAQLGTTAEDQEMAERRVRLLTATPARRRFVSAEPILGPIDLVGTLGRPGPAVRREGDRLVPLVHQVIIGGESGARARPFDVAWARALVRQLRDAGIAPFVKQLGALPVEDEASWRAASTPHPASSRNRRRAPAGMIALHLESGKGVNPEEWPEDLRVREMPEETAP